MGCLRQGRVRSDGAITDKGPCVTYKTVTGFIPGGLHFACKGNKGAITFVVRIDTGTGTSRWTINRLGCQEVQTVCTASAQKARRGSLSRGPDSNGLALTRITAR